MVMMWGVCGCHDDGLGTVRMLNELGVAQANEVGRLYLGVRLTGNNEQSLVKAVAPLVTSLHHSAIWAPIEERCMSFYSNCIHNELHGHCTKTGSLSVCSSCCCFVFSAWRKTGGGHVFSRVCVCLFVCARAANLTY